MGVEWEQAAAVVVLWGRGDTRVRGPGADESGADEGRGGQVKGEG